MNFKSCLKAGEHGESLGKKKLYVNERVVAQREMKTQASARCTFAPTFCERASGFPTIKSSLGRLEAYPMKVGSPTATRTRRAADSRVPALAHPEPAAEVRRAVVLRDRVPAR